MMDAVRIRCLHCSSTSTGTCTMTHQIYSSAGYGALCGRQVTRQLWVIRRSL